MGNQVQVTSDTPSASLITPGYPVRYPPGGHLPSPASLDNRTRVGVEYGSLAPRSSCTTRGQSRRILGDAEQVSRVWKSIQDSPRHHSLTASRVPSQSWSCELQGPKQKKKQENRYHHQQVLVQVIQHIAHTSKPLAQQGCMSADSLRFGNPSRPVTPHGFPRPLQLIGGDG